MDKKGLTNQFREAGSYNALRPRPFVALITPLTLELDT